MFRIVIPARYDSTRLPGKALLPLAGRPMIEWVYRRALAAGARETWVATDDERIVAACARFGAPSVLTAAHHPSGTDRIAEVARRLGWADEDIVVNLQGDEPLMPPALIGQVAALLAADAGAQIATLAGPLSPAAGGDARAALHDPNIVKVVVDAHGHALYFSRAPIPWQRDGGGVHALARRHIGLYAYRVAALARLTALPPGALEECEKLEQLRALAQGFVIRVADACAAPGPDVNTADDLARVAAMLACEPASAGT